MQVLLNKNNKRSKLIGVANVAQLEVLDFLDVSEGGLGTTGLGAANAMLVSNGTVVRGQSSLAFDGTLLRINGNGFASDSASGRVGVGTGTPGNRLSLVGDLPVGNATVDRTFECSFASASSDRDKYLTPSSSNASVLDAWNLRTATYGNWTIDASRPRFAQAANGTGFVDSLMTEHDLVLMFPATLPGNIGVYDVYRKVFLDPVAIDTSGQSYDVSGGCLLKSGKVLVTTKTAHFFIVDLAEGITTSVSVSSNVQAVQGQANAYLSGGTMLPDGRVFFVPGTAPRACAYLPVTNTVDFIGPVHSEAQTIKKYKSSVLMPDGRLCYVPFDATHMAIYDPSTNGYTQVPFDDASPEKFSAGVLAPNGYVFFAPKNINYALALNPSNFNNTKITTGTVESIDNFCGGILAPDGRVVLVPSGRSAIVLLNIDTFDRFEVPVDNPSVSQKYGGQVLASDGTIVMAPMGQTRVGLLGGAHAPPRDYARVLHPFYSAV